MQNWRSALTPPFDHHFMPYFKFITSHHLVSHITLHFQYSTLSSSIQCLHISNSFSAMDDNCNDRPPEFVRLQVVPHEFNEDATPSIQDTTSIPAPEIDISISNVMIPSHEFNDRLQDRGCTLHQLPKNTYKQSKIPPYGPKEKSLYYYHLLV